MTALGNDRPRELHWYHAGPMLFGDLGTSRLYVLGLAFYFTRHASLFHILFVNILLLLVGGCYLIICRKYPDGGGVYSAARSTSRALAVVGGLTLCADYTVTAALSCLDAFRYFGVGGEILGVRIELLCTLAAIAAIGFVNWFGPRGMGRVALFVAVLTVLLTLVITVCAIPSLHHTRIELPVRERYSLTAWSDAWVGFTEIVLALSGIEAIANMTGIMVSPVRVTSRRSIVPVLLEVVTLNILLGAAMNALPDAKLIDPEGHALGTDNMMNILATAYVGGTFSFVASFVFGALLLSAVNTAITDLMAIQYMMARDGEAPALLACLNRHGVPGYGLLLAMFIPAGLLVMFPDLTQLAGLYSVGVVSAITINLLTTGSTKQFDLRAWERWLLCGVGVLMACILVTLLWNKPHARIFSMAILVVGLGARLFTLAGRSTLSRPYIRAVCLFAAVCCIGQVYLALMVPADSPAVFAASAAAVGLLVWVGQFVSASIPQQEAATALDDFDGDYHPDSCFMVSASRSSPLISGVIEEARRSQASVVVLFVRELAIPVMGSGTTQDASEDPDARAIFGEALAPARRLGVPVKLMYLVGGSVVDRIVQTATDVSASRIYMQISKRHGIMRFFKGDVIGPVAERLPEHMELVIRV
ncbi:MAG: amino acid permease [Planctomycetota bacterium]